jgi:hypothetical protein
VKSVAFEPTVTADGDTKVIVGRARWTVNVVLALVADVGLTTRIAPTRAVVNIVGVATAVSCVGETKVVAIARPSS